MLFLDYRKAFDRVNHHILLSKLKEHDVPEFLVNWIASCLYDRKQSVKVGDKISDWCHIQAEVPQGTLLGPITLVRRKKINFLKKAKNNIHFEGSLLQKTIQMAKDS